MGSERVAPAEQTMAALVAFYIRTFIKERRGEVHTYRNPYDNRPQWLFPCSDTFRKSVKSLYEYPGPPEGYLEMPTASGPTILEWDIDLYDGMLGVMVTPAKL